MTDDFTPVTSSRREDAQKESGIHKIDPAGRRREIFAGGKVKGGILAAHVRWVTETHSPKDAERFWKSLPPELRNAAQSVDPTQWYEFSDLIAIDRAIVDVLGSGAAAVLRELGAWSARINLQKTDRNTEGAVHSFLETSARLHPQFQDFGKAHYVRTGHTSGRVVHSSYTSFSPLYCESAIGYYGEAVALHGMNGASVIETQCQCRGDDSCTFVIRWR